MAAPSVDLTIIMPAYNEETTILDAVQTAIDAKLPVGTKEIIVVENGSQDRTRELLRSREWPEEVRMIEIDDNRGKGGAVRLAAQHARGTWVAILDADMEYDPNDYARMLGVTFEDETVSMVLGTRHWQAHSAYSYWYVVGNRAINQVANMIYNVWLTDCMVGMKLVRTDLFNSLELRENGFGFDAEVVCKMVRRGARIHEVPVKYRARSREEGKKLTIIDGFRMLKVFLQCRFAPKS